MANDKESLKGKVAFITGASRGIGLATALRLAREGASIAIAAKTDQPHPNLPGTIHTAKEAIEAIGGKALALKVDIRDEEAIHTAVEQTAEHFGGIDILINNASAINLTSLENTSQKKYDLMHQINGRGSFLCAKHALKYLKKSKNPHILNASPPLDMVNTPFGEICAAYTASKILMTLWTLCLSKELRKDGIAVNSIWPTGAIDTAAIRNLMPGFLNDAKDPQIVADASYFILSQDASKVTGQCFIDEEVLKSHGVNDLSIYDIHH